jgi:hypothetical protein
MFSYSIFLIPVLTRPKTSLLNVFSAVKNPDTSMVSILASPKFFEYKAVPPPFSMTITHFKLWRDFSLKNRSCSSKVIPSRWTPDCWKTSIISERGEASIPSSSADELVLIRDNSPFFLPRISNMTPIFLPAYLPLANAFITP